MLSVTIIVLTFLIVVLVITLRWFSYKEQMALISQGLPLKEKRSKEEKAKLLLAGGLIITLLGLAASIGLFTLGIGPWLLIGLIPLFLGLAMILIHLVLRPSKEKAEPEPAVPDWKAAVEPTEAVASTDLKEEPEEIEPEEEQETEENLWEEEIEE